MLSLRSAIRTRGSAISVVQLAHQNGLAFPASLRELLRALGVGEGQVKHVFVLMLENRSFDHMLGFSNIRGADATTGRPTTIEGLKGTESNSVESPTFTLTFTVQEGAADVMADGPGHEFEDVLEQLCGRGAVYPSGGPYPRIDNSGFVSNYVKKAGVDSAGEVMKCFGPSQLPVLNALAREFVVCDHWFCSLPGPTEPNRYFMHAATSGDFDESPSQSEIAAALFTPGGGFEFKNGTIFDQLDTAGVNYRIYADDSFPVVAELDGVSILSIDEFENFAEDLRDPDFDAGFVHIEPSYDALDDFEDGNSQHPSGSVAAGERFIKATYEAIRNSPVWETSLLIITWDEHGGFYDHVIPGPAPATGERGRAHGFTFDQLGPRVPAIIVSPLIPKNLIAKEVFDHTAIPATLRRVFNLPSLGERDGMSGGVDHLAIYPARTDTPVMLPDVVTPAVAEALHRPSLTGVRRPEAPLAVDLASIEAAQLHSAVVQHLAIGPADQHAAIRARFSSLKTRADAFTYLQEVQQLVHGKRVEVHQARESVGPGHVSP